MTNDRLYAPETTAPEKRRYALACGASQSRAGRDDAFLFVGGNVGKQPQVLDEVSKRRRGHVRQTEHGLHCPTREPFVDQPRTK